MKDCDFNIIRFLH